MKADINGTILTYSDRGDGLPLLLIHGFPLCRKMWRPQAEALSKAGCRVISPDLRGFGESPLTAESMSISDYADDMVRLLDYLGIDKAVVGGMSMGGYLLLNLLERYPERIAAAIFIVTKAEGDDEAGRVRRTMLAETCLAEGVLPLAEAFHTILFAPATLTDNPELVEEVFGWMRDADPRGAAAALLAMRDRKDYVSRLGSITHPALVIAAGQDQAIGLENSRLIAETIPGTQLSLLHDAGHMANMEQPAAFNAAVLEFLAGL